MRARLAPGIKVIPARICGFLWAVSGAPVEAQDALREDGGGPRRLYWLHTGGTSEVGHAA